jgi:phage shock protein C
MQTKRLRRSRHNRMLGGVCGGIAEYFGIDPTIVRIMFVLLSLPGGVPGPLIYAILWLALPQE